MSGPPVEAVAVVDCGTNSTRLLVTGGDGPPLRRERVTGLGRGVDRGGRLGRAGIDATLAAVSDYRADMERSGVGSGRRVLATSAVRDAANGDELLGPLRELVGVDPEVLSGETEGRLAFAGATAGLAPPPRPTLVLDVGGGSTELAFGTDRCEAVRSLDVGSVRLTERYLAHDPPRPEELSALLSVVELYLDDVIREVPEVLASERLVGVAGTVTTVAAVEIGLDPYDADAIHHFELTHDAAEDVFRTLATEALVDRVHNPGLAPERGDVIVAGCAILVGVMRRFGFASCLVSEADLLDGAAAELGGRAARRPSPDG